MDGLALVPQCFPFLPREIEQHELIGKGLFFHTLSLPGRPLHPFLAARPTGFSLGRLMGKNRNEEFVDTMLRDGKEGIAFGEMMHVVAEFRPMRARYVRGDGDVGFHREFDAHVRPFVKEGIRALVAVASVCRRWRQAIMPWFRIVYMAVANLLARGHEQVMLKHPTLPAELCMRHLLLGLWHHTAFFQNFIKLSVKKRVKIVDWRTVQQELYADSLILRRPGPGGHGDMYVLTREEEVDIIKQGIANQLAASDWSFELVLSFPGMADVLPATAVSWDATVAPAGAWVNARRKWLDALRRAFIRRDGLANWHEAYSRGTCKLEKRLRGTQDEVDEEEEEDGGAPKRKRQRRLPLIQAPPPPLPVPPTPIYGPLHLLAYDVGAVPPPPPPLPFPTAMSAAVLWPQ
jgi:hypothetical protein